LDIATFRTLLVIVRVKLLLSGFAEWKTRVALPRYTFSRSAALKIPLFGVLSKRGSEIDGDLVHSDVTCQRRANERKPLQRAKTVLLLKFVSIGSLCLSFRVQLQIGELIQSLTRRLGQR
jgi:hypothetical protein